MFDPYSFFMMNRFYLSSSTFCPRFADETVIQAFWRTCATNKTIYTMLALAMELPIMTLFTKFTMAVAGCSGSSSANTWHWLSDLCAGFLATNPKHRLKNEK